MLARIRNTYQANNIKSAALIKPSAADFVSKPIRYARPFSKRGQWRSTQPDEGLERVTSANFILQTAYYVKFSVILSPLPRWHFF